MPTAGPTFGTIVGLAHPAPSTLRDTATTCARSAIRGILCRVRELSFVILSGPPGSGKSTLATPLASKLGMPLFSKDTIKEALMDSLGVGDPEESRRLGAASMQTILALAHENRCGILEANWRPSVAVEALRSLPGRVVEVFCDCDTRICRERYERRATTRKPGHFDASRIDDVSMWAGEASKPVGGGWPVIAVDTSTPVDYDALLVQIMAATSSA